jgi:tetratricopeptide (TPR) repeat protein
VYGYSLREYSMHDDPKLITPASGRVPSGRSVDLDTIEKLHHAGASIESLRSHIEILYRSNGIHTADRGRAAFLMGNCYQDVNRDLSTSYYLEALRIAKQVGPPRALADALHGRAVIAYQSKDFASVIRLEHDSIEIALGSGYIYRQCFCLYMLATLAFRFGQDEDALVSLEKSLRFAQEMKYLAMEVRLHAKLAEITHFSRQLQSAREFAIKGLTVAESLDRPKEIVKLQIRLCTIDLELGEYTAVTKLVSKLRCTLPKENHSLWAVTHTLLGNVHAAKRRWVKAEVEFRAALKLADYVNAERVRSNIHTHLSELYLKTKQYKPALKESLAALKDAETAQDVFVRKDALRLVHQCYKAIGKFKEAHKYLELYNELVAASDTALLKNRLEYHALRNEFEKERLVSADKARQSEILRLELVRKEQELTEKTRHLIKQTEALVQFRDDLRAMIRRSPSDDPLVKQIRERLQSLPDAQLNWEDFDVQFRNVHPEFLKNLVKKYPTLTTMQRKVCALLRLNLTSVDIAKLLYLSERNIENHRYRLRKKFCLDANGSLHDFLSTY